MVKVTFLVNIQLKMLSRSLCCADLSLLNRCYQKICADPWVVLRSRSLGSQLMSASGNRKCQRKSYFTSRLHIFTCSESSSGSFWLFGSVTMTSDITFRFHLSIYSFFLMFEQLMQSTLGFHDTKVRLCCRSCDQASSGIFPGLIKNASRSISPRLQILHHISPPEQTTLVYVHYSFCVLPGRH